MKSKLSLNISQKLPKLISTHHLKVDRLLEHFMLLFCNIYHYFSATPTGIDFGSQDDPQQIQVILNGETVSEFQPYIDKGYYGIAVAGGYVYRDKAMPELVGQYIFADFGSDAKFFHVPVDELVDGKQAKIKELRLFNGDREVSFLEIIGKERSDVRFGVDEEGEIYLTSKQDGKVRKLVSSSKTSS